MEENVCLAEINIGSLSASAVKSNKRQAKLFAAKNLLRTIDSNTFLKGKFFYYLRDPRDFYGQVRKITPWVEPYPSYPEPTDVPQVEKAEDDIAAIKVPPKTEVEVKPAPDLQDEDVLYEVRSIHIEDSIDLKRSLTSLDSVLKPIESQQLEVNQIFMQVSEVIKVLLPGGYTKVIPLGSYLLGCMRKQNLIVDCLLFDSRSSFTSIGLSPANEISLIKLKELFQERKSTFQLINNHYQLYQVVAA